MGVLGLPFWIHSILLWVGMSLIINPTRWCLLGSAHATGGASDTALTIAFIAAAVFSLYYVIHVIKAMLNKKEEYLAFCAAATVVVVLFLYGAIAASLLVVDTWVDWAWAGMTLASVYGALAIMVSKED